MFAAEHIGTHAQPSLRSRATWMETQPLTCPLPLAPCAPAQGGRGVSDTAAFLLLKGRIDLDAMGPVSKAAGQDRPHQGLAGLHQGMGSRAQTLRHLAEEREELI